MSVMRVIVLHPVSSLNLVGLPVQKPRRIFHLSINRPRDLDLSTSIVEKAFLFIFTSIIGNKIIIYNIVYCL